MKLIKLFLLLIFISCNNDNENKASKDTEAVSEKDATSQNASDAQPNDSTINIQFPKGSFSIKVEGKIKGINHPITVNIPVKQGTQLTAYIQPEDSVANIRINQIFTPSGKADGPFGRDLKYAIKGEGNYKLIIGENLMQGDEWKGKFWLTVAVR